MLTKGIEQWYHTSVPNFSKAPVATRVLIVAPNYPREGARRSQEAQPEKPHLQESLGQLGGEEGDSVLNKKFLYECPVLTNCATSILVNKFLELQS